MASLFERAKLIQKAKRDKALQHAIKQLCKQDIVFWFDWFCWTYNPRVKPHHFPFNLYPYQKQIVRTLKECISTSEGCMVEKSRDMGLTWLVMLTYHYFWLFEEGSDFHVGSRLKDLTDTKGVISTLIEKVRYNHSRLPAWMAPRMNKYQDTKCRLVHPVTGSTITGEAATPDFARSQRYKSVMLDELARLPYGELAYLSATQSTDCAIGLWTPWGKNNIAYAFNQSTEIERIKLTNYDSEEEKARIIRIATA